MKGVERFNHFYYYPIFMNNINDAFLRLADKYPRPVTPVPNREELVQEEMAKSLKGAEVEFGGKLIQTLLRRS